MTTTGTPPLSDAELAVVEIAVHAVTDNSERKTAKQLLATIAQRDAQLAAVTEALKGAHKALQQANGSKRLARLDPPARTQLQSASWACAAALKDIPATASSWIAEREALRFEIDGLKSTLHAVEIEATRLRSTQRAPGTVEKCGMLGCDRLVGSMADKCTAANCPISRAQPETEG